MGPKYEFTDETRDIYGETLHRIRRISNGALGGWIAKESNLSQHGNCWVDNEAEVYGDAEVYGNAQILDRAQVYGTAVVCEEAKICDDAKVYENACVYGEAKVFGLANVRGNAEISGGAKIFENAIVYGNAVVKCMGRVYEDASVGGNAVITNNDKVFGSMNVTGPDAFGPKQAILDFASKINNYTSLKIWMDYRSIDDFFDYDYSKYDSSRNMLIIYDGHTQDTVVQIDKVESKDKRTYKFSSEFLSDDDEEIFVADRIINSREDIEQYVRDMEEAFRDYPEYDLYIKELKTGLQGE